MANNNYREPNTKKRGRPANKLSVRLFLLDPDTMITKVTKDTCSKSGIEALMQRGYGPPPIEHCVKDDKVEFMLDLTTEQFKQKLIEIYPKLENTCFVFMRADKTNKLEELNPGWCCFRCYTPENVYNSERGQGRLYMRVIAENEISPCAHGISRTKRLCGMAGGSQQFFVPILPKPVSTLTTSDVTSAVAMPTGQTETSQSGSNSNQSQLSSSSITLSTMTPLDNGSVNVKALGPLVSFVSTTTPGVIGSQSNLPTSTVSQPESNQPVNSGLLTQWPISTSTIVPQVGLAPPLQNRVSILEEGLLQTSPAVNSSVTLTPFLQNSVNIASQSRFLSPAVFSMTGQSQPADNSSNVAAQRQQTSISTSFIAGNTVLPAIRNSNSFVPPGQLESFSPWSMTPQGQSSRSAGIPDANLLQSLPGTHPSNQTVVEQDLDSQLRTLAMMVFAAQNPIMASNSTVPSSLPLPALPPLRSVQSPGLNTLLDAISHHEQNAESSSSSVISSNVQGPVNPRESKLPDEFRIQKFLENVESTKKLTISLAALDDDLLLKKLKESKVEIHTIEVHSACKVHKVLSVYSLPSCLKVLRIINNVLNHEDIYSLNRCFSSENSLHELDFSRTKFEKNSFHSFIGVLMNCNDLIKLFLSDNCLAKQEIFGLMASLECMKSLKNINLSKNNLRVLELHGQLDSIVSLDISYSALQGNASIIEICKLQSLEEINLSHNHIKFFPLPNFITPFDKFPINMKAISLSFNYMTPEDFSQFCLLSKSNLMKLDLDSNHIGNSIWSLCSLYNVRYLKVLSLASTDVCVAVDGLAVLLSSVRELEELNLSSNNLVLNDFRQLQLPLSNLTQLKKLNLSNNPEGVSAVLQESLSSLKNLQEIRLSNTHMNGEDLVKMSDLLASLRDLRYLDLSMNAIGSDGTRTLANLLKGFSLLEGLDLSQSLMTGSDIRVLWNSFAAIKGLKYLNLFGNQIDVNAFDNSLSFPPALEELIISDIIHGKKLFDTMSPLQNLRKLHLINLRLRACDVEALAAMLSSFSMLEEISLAHAVADSSIDKIFSAIKCLHNIKIIDLSGIKLPDVNVLADMISSLSFLEELVLAEMFFENGDRKKLIDALVLMKSLRIFNLHSAKEEKKMYRYPKISREFIRQAIWFVGVEDTKQVCAGLGKIRYLKELSLKVSRNEECINLLAEVLPSLQLLEKFVLEFDGEKLFYIKGIEKLFTALGKLINLRDLELFMCRGYFENNALNALAQTLSSLQLLEKLVLYLPLYEDDDKDEVVDKDEMQLVITAIGKLKNLRELVLREPIASRIFQGEVLASLPLLEKLKLIEWETESEWGERMFHLEKVRYLKQVFIFCGYPRATAEAISKVLPSLPFLETLVFIPENSREVISSPLVQESNYLRELDSPHVDINSQVLFNGSRSLYLLEKLRISRKECVEQQWFQNLGKLRYLKKLSLNLYDQSIDDVKVLVGGLSSLSSLEKISLKRIELGNKGEKRLFASLTKMKFLRKLSLKRLAWNSVEGLVYALSSLQSLEKIKLARIRFDNESEKQLFASLAKLRSLKKLSLSHRWDDNTQSEMDSLAKALSALNLLEKLSLRDINCTKGDQQLVTAIASLSYLKELDLCGSKITDAGGEALVAVLPNLHNLRCFRLPVSEDYTRTTKLEEAVRRAVPYVRTDF